MPANRRLVDRGRVLLYWAGGAAALGVLLGALSATAEIRSNQYIGHDLTNVAIGTWRRATLASLRDAAWLAFSLAAFWSFVTAGRRTLSGVLPGTGAVNTE